MSRVVKGVPYVTTGRGIRIHPVDGSSSHIVIEGESADVLGLINSFPGGQIDYTEADGFGRLEVRFGNIQGQTEVPVYIWELLGNDLLKDIFENPNSIALGSDNLSLIKDKFDATTADERDGIALNDAEALLYDRLVRGQTSYYVGSPVLRKTVALNDEAQIILSYAGVGSIFFAATIINQEPTMDVAVRLGLDQLNSIMTNAQVGYTWGWLKKMPSLTSRWGQKRELTQEWVGDYWDTDYTYRLA